MAAALRLSSYNLQFGLPHGGRSLVMHGYTGALDLMSPTLSDFLCTPEMEQQLSDVEHELRESLQDRGYLTTQSEDDERAYVGKVFEVFQRRQQPSVTIGLRLKGTSAELMQGFLADPAALFGALNKLREFHVGGALALDLTRVSDTIDGFFPRLLELASDWSYSLIVTIKAAMAPQLAPYLDRRKIQYIRIFSMDPDVSGEAAGLMQLFEQTLTAGVRCDWLFSVDGRQDDQIQETYDRAVQLKRMRKDKPGVINVLFVSESESAAVKLLAEAKEPITVITTAELPLYYHLCRFVEMQGLVNLKPYFSTPDTNYVLESSGEVSVVSRDGKPGSLHPIGRFAEGTISFHNGFAPGTALAACGHRSTECDRCPYSLICGVHCGAQHVGEGNGESRPSIACGEVFKQKVERVVPSMFFNKIGIA